MWQFIACMNSIVHVKAAYFFLCSYSWAISAGLGITVCVVLFQLTLEQRSDEEALESLRIKKEELLESQHKLKDDRSVMCTHNCGKRVSWSPPFNLPFRRVI